MYLRGIARQLKTDVNVGKAGLSEGAIGHVQALLEQRELVKLRLFEPAAEDRKQAAADLAGRAGAALVDVVGTRGRAVSAQPEPAVGATTETAAIGSAIQSKNERPTFLLRGLRGRVFADGPCSAARTFVHLYRLPPETRRGRKMIRFICQKCRKAVRVPDASGGKKGICPFCKQLILIPIHDDPTIDPAQFDEIRGLDDTSIRLPVLSNMDETDLDIPDIPDTSQDTVRLDAPLRWTAQAGHAGPRASAAHASVAGSTRRLYSLLMAVAVVVLAVGASSVWYSLRHGHGRAQGVARRARIARPHPRPRRPMAHSLSTAMIPILRHVPSGTFGLLHVDFARSANMLSQVVANDPPLLRQAAALPYWANAPEKCSQGIIPVTMTLYVVSTFEPTDKLFGPWYGVPQRRPDPTPNRDRGRSGRGTASRPTSCFT